jgi:hypothetical protein
MQRKNACDPSLCSSCGAALLPGPAVCGRCRALRRAAHSAKGSLERRHRQTADKLATKQGPRPCLCGRVIRWAYEYCSWCRDALAAEDAAAELRDANDNRVTLAEHARRNHGVRDYSMMRLEVLRRTKDGTLEVCDNYGKRDDAVLDGWW